jgi:hypothetical protein
VLEGVTSRDGGAGRTAATRHIERRGNSLGCLSAFRAGRCRLGRHAASLANAWRPEAPDVTDRANSRRSISPAEPLWCRIEAVTIQRGRECRKDLKKLCSLPRHKKDSQHPGFREPAEANFFRLTGNRVLKTAFVLRDGPLAPSPSPLLVRPFEPWC